MIPKEIMKIPLLKNLSMNYMPVLNKNPHVIHYPNVKYSVFVKINVTLPKKQKHLLQIPVRDLHNEMILPSSEEVFFVQEQLMRKFV